MSDRGLEETVHSLRRIATTGAVAAAVVLVGAVLLLALSLLFSLARFSPYGLWLSAAVLGVAALAGAMVWWRGPRAIGAFGGRSRATVTGDLVLRAPPPPPARATIALPRPDAGGRLGMEAMVNRLIDERRYDDALNRLADIEASDPAMTTFCAAKRRAIHRRRALRR
jgi:hypothetical protein